MNTVYILGAGCSKNYEVGRSPYFPELEIPVDKNFLSVSSKILLNDQKYLIKYNDLIREILMQFLPEEQYWKFYSKQRKDEVAIMKRRCKYLSKMNISLEKVFSILDSQSIMNLGSQKYVSDLIDLVTITLDYSLRGEACNLHYRLADKIKKSDSIISYNYDILMDNALLHLNSFNENGYHIPFSSVYENGEKRRPKSENSEIDILKLHGSLNWIKCQSCGCMLFYSQRKIGSEIAFLHEFCPTCGSGNLYRMIIPPTINKKVDMIPFSRLWELANKKIRMSEKIVVIGYSMPPTDFISEAMFRGATRDEMAGRELDIVNPSFLKLKKRFSNIFGTNNVKCYSDLRKYLDGFESTKN